MLESTLNDVGRLLVTEVTEDESVLILVLDLVLEVFIDLVFEYTFVLDLTLDVFVNLVVEYFLVLVASLVVTFFVLLTLVLEFTASLQDPKPG